MWRNVRDPRVSNGSPQRCRSVEPAGGREKGSPDARHGGRGAVTMTKPRNDRDGELEDGPDEQHRRPPGVDDITVRALGKLSEALETVERARGHLYAMHQLTGTADFQLDEAVSLFMQCGR